MQLYGLDMGRDQFQRRFVRCQVTREVMVSGGTVAAHLFPSSYRVSQLLRFALYRPNAAMPLDCLQFTSAAMLHIGQSCAGLFDLLLKGALFLLLHTFPAACRGSKLRRFVAWK